ncbi:ABC transporter permease [Chitinophaga niabensis]|uniref:Duplicated orphan permease n=1 Tax=Chitinophaga niabensis TaxID=536979 RepID=A0A1N6K6E3_9BACT|nr:FtsX-like permease family protein [Chitinophaga niabensis]SIO52131.1 duplicated orphan permease [Chitinophaga niabensis]
MFKNYLVVTWRSLWKNKTFSAINISGLAIGLSASLVIYLLVSYHFGFNKFDRDGDRIYRIVSDFVFTGVEYHNSGVTSPLGRAVQNELTGFDEVAAFRTWNDGVKVSVADAHKSFKKQRNIIFANVHYFNLFRHQWIAGTPATALQQPYQTVLTASNAQLYFPGLSASEIIGRELYFNDTVRTTVTGIVNDFKENTDFAFKIFVSYSTLSTTGLKPEDWDQWSSTNGASQLFVKLSAGAQVPQVEKEINKLYNKYNKPEPGNNNKTSYRLQPLNDIHFNSTYGAFGQPLANKQTLYGLLAIAAFLLLLGCINFINLTTAQAAQRAKEIGVRKAIGSSQKQLILQFLGETFQLTLIAALLSILLTPLILKAFAGFIPEGLGLSLATQPGVLLFLILLILLVTVLSGFYPALVLAGYNPVQTLKNQTYANAGKTRNAWMRKSLTVSQFVIAQVFILATVVVSKQIHYSLNKDLGFKKDAIVYFSTNVNEPDAKKRISLMNKLKAIPEIAMVSLGSAPPSSNGSWSSTMRYKDLETDVQVKIGDTGYLKLYGLQLLAGENIQHSDTVNGVLINERYAQILGFATSQQAIGQYITWDEERHVPITGVIANFHQTSLREPIKPLIIAHWSAKANTFSIALYPQNKAGTAWKAAFGKMEKAWKEIYPEEDFSYSFFNEEIARFYKNERQISRLLMWAAALAIFISSLGLLGLVIYTIRQRTKEIGVRKILGASVVQIVTLISKEFILLVILAFIIAIPLAWLSMHQWLQQFAYRTGMSSWIFVVSGLVMLSIALLTLGLQTIRAALVNPVKSLRAE